MKLPSEKDQSEIINYHNRGYSVEQIMEIVRTVSEEQVLEVLERYEEQFT